METLSRDHNVAWGIEVKRFPLVHPLNTDRSAKYFLTSATVEVIRICGGVRALR